LSRWKKWANLKWPLEVIVFYRTLAPVTPRSRQTDYLPYLGRYSTYVARPTRCMYVPLSSNISTNFYSQVLGHSTIFYHPTPQTRPVARLRPTATYQGFWDISHLNGLTYRPVIYRLSQDMLDKRHARSTFADQTWAMLERLSSRLSTWYDERWCMMYGVWPGLELSPFLQTYLRKMLAF
jgi:hypothetical protein